MGKQSGSETVVIRFCYELISNLNSRLKQPLTRKDKDASLDSRWAER